MNEILKQRLVGALILVALGVVFWPIIFVQPPQQQTLSHPSDVTEATVEEAAPAGRWASPQDSQQPEFTVVDEAETIEASASEESAEVVSVEASQPTAVESDRSEAPAVAQAPQPVDTPGGQDAWILQVATVSTAEKAEKLRLRLLDMNQKAYVTRVSSGGKSLHRVCIGPNTQQRVLDRLRPTIDAEFGVTSMVVRFTP